MTLGEFLHHGPVAVAFLVTAVAGVLILAMLVVASATSSLREDAFLAQVNKLILADNADRAAKLCAAGGKRPVAVLVGVGVDVVLRSGLRPADAVERAKAAMADRLPVLVRALMAGVAAAGAVVCLTTTLGALVLTERARAQPWAIVLGAWTIVAGLATSVIETRVSLRSDLMRAVADFGPRER
jgi:hypothetical protein